MKKSVWMGLRSSGAILLFSLAVFMVVSCNDDENNQISLHYVENNFLELYYPNTGNYAASIIGGDGNYTVLSSDTSILKVEIIYGQTVSFKSVAIGEAIVTIKDQSNNSYVLDVQVAYRKQSITIKKHDVRIEGEALTENEITELRQKALATIPVNTGGGYRFIYTEADGHSGTIHIYPEGFDKDYIEGTFVILREVNDNSTFYSYKINFDDSERIFVIRLYNSEISLRTSEVEPHAIVEDMTDQFKADYPKLDAIYTLQVIGTP